MATSTGRLCGPCVARHATTVALIWCTSCNEGLCTNCLEHHAVSKASSKHQTIPVSQFIGLESFLTSIKQDCESHGRKFDLYCLDHSAPCCISCIPVQHPKCKRVRPIDELSRQARTSDALPDIDRGFKELQKTITEIKSHQQKNLDKMEKQRSKIVLEIKAMKLKVNNYLDKLESEVLKELAETSQKEKAKIDDMLEELNAKEGSIQLLVTTINQLNSLPDVQVFLASKELEARLNDEEKWATDVCCKDKATETDIKFPVEQQLERIMSEIKTFGKIQVSHSPIQITVGAWKHQQAQISVPHGTVRQVEDIHLQLVYQIEFEGSVNVKDCCTLPDGKMIFAEYAGHKLLVYNEDGRFCKKISTGDSPYGLTVIDSTTVAVGCSNEMVQIIDITAGVVKNTMRVNGRCHGISYNKGKVYILAIHRGIEEYDVDGKYIRTIPVDFSGDDEYLCCCSEGFCYTSGFSVLDKYIAFCDVNGKELWKSDVGNNGVTVDNTGHIFVTNYSTSSLFVMSADGKRTKRLLSRKDGLSGPEGVYYNKEKNTLLVVTSYKGSAALYRVI